MILDLNEKLCKLCGNTKPIDQFSWSNRAKGKRSSTCKDCHRKHAKRHYLNNKSTYLRRSLEFGKNYITECTRTIILYLLDHPCVDCGETDPLVLDFDHLGNKENDICRMIQYRRKLERIKTEMAKCEVRCANCHRRKTAREQNHRRYILLQEIQILNILPSPSDLILKYRMEYNLPKQARSTRI